MPVELIVVTVAVVAIFIVALWLSLDRKPEHKHIVRDDEPLPPIRIDQTSLPATVSAKPALRPTVEATPSRPTEIRGRARIIDGDTIVIRDTRIRLAGIDAPELEHPWGKKSKFALIALCKGREVVAEVTGDLSHGRLVARCRLCDGTDLAAELVKQGLALDWASFSGGGYKHLEPHGIRKKLWRAAARQRGDMKAFNAPVQPRKAP